MHKYPNPTDLQIFIAVVLAFSFEKIAHDMAASPAYIAKRIKELGNIIGLKLLHRTTRRVSITDAGEIVHAQAVNILAHIDNLVEGANLTNHVTKGELKICSSFGFGRKIIAPTIGELQRNYSQLKIRFEIFDKLIDIANEGFDLDVRVGDEISPHLIAGKLADNHRILCASPSYLAKNSAPKTRHDLSKHNCLIIKERDLPFGNWTLLNGRKS